MPDSHFQIGNISSRAFPQPSPPLNVHDGGPLRLIALPPPFPHPSSTPTPPEEDYEMLDSNIDDSDFHSHHHLNFQHHPHFQNHRRQMYLQENSRHHNIGNGDDMNEDFEPLGASVNARDYIFDVMRYDDREGLGDIFGRDPNQRNREGGHRP